MKKILFLFSICLIGLGVKAQGSLQFNQVVVINNGISYTVPSGKVFKIESLNNSRCFCDSNTPIRLYTPSQHLWR